ncbi:methyl-accepting chemotaxis protein [Haloferax mucosum ATCC BAA-1512]|uniref:Methyl-accepting chemotaxis protein n=1 Tax=Haloferax mucosum ATCC BAA-1512 TaxID=662479 RepID=M0IEP5_9EURY|nr:hypothetical protein [Haloferax mucosum]ELZ94512.1 methyl-accepting chemotaxis protein [Haloferax mucosum ATCC BAA-1512]
MPREVAAASEEQTTSLSEVSDGTDELATQAEELMNNVAAVTVRESQSDDIDEVGKTTDASTFNFGGTPSTGQ